MSTVPDDRVGTVDLDPYAPDLTEPAAWDVYEAARATAPVVHSSRRGGFWMVTGYDDVRAVLRDATTFSSASGHRIPTDGTQRAVPIDFDPPMHTAYRKLMTPALSPTRNTSNVSGRNPSARRPTSRRCCVTAAPPRTSPAGRPAR